MDSSSCRAKGQSDLRNEGGMLSGPAVSLHFIFLMADRNSDSISSTYSFWCQISNNQSLPVGIVWATFMTLS